MGQLPEIMIPAAPALVAVHGGAIWLTQDGETSFTDKTDVYSKVLENPPFLCHRTATTSRLGLENERFPCFDLLELFAFVRPAYFVIPTIRGLAAATSLPEPESHDDEAACLFSIATELLNELANARMQGNVRQEVNTIAQAMHRSGWLWGSAVTNIISPDRPAQNAVKNFHVWENLEEWNDQPPQAPSGNIPISDDDARKRLADMLGINAEDRPGQVDYVTAANMAFQPRETPDSPIMVLAEAGTGTGKTLGYIAPASLWAEKNEATVWISTYTRNLQRQIDNELDRLYPDKAQKYSNVVIRKGRENYLCLLNLEEALQRLPTSGHGVALGLISLWVIATRDGDMTGGDLPGWIGELFPRHIVYGLTDRRGECVYTACDHFRKCFIERNIRRSRNARIVVANHALVMMLSASGGLDDINQPTRYIFDEGHHLFDAADSAFSTNMSGLEAVELRRWLLGEETESRSRRVRGLRRRCEDLLTGNQDAIDALNNALNHARNLPSHGWLQRLAQNQPQGVFERFIFLIRQQILARTDEPQSQFSLECDPNPPIEGLIATAKKLSRLLLLIEKPLQYVSITLIKRLDDDADELETSTRQRIEAMVNSINRRSLQLLRTWETMLDNLENQQPNRSFIDWFAIDRIDGRDVDIGYHRHWIDPMEPFATTVLNNAHAVLATSATLLDNSGDTEKDWLFAEKRTGAIHLTIPANRALLPSPFDYQTNTRLIIVTDVRKDDLNQVSAAYRELFLAARGGGLGLFTAIARLKAVHQRIAGYLDDAGITLLAQHIDTMDTGTLVDIFRASENSCLLGTDAVRDGVDVPGRSLRLIVFDRVPWHRPDILHKTRRTAFGRKEHDDQITRLRLKQAFGRLVRRQSDNGVFILLDPQIPSRLLSAFPDGVTVTRMGLAETIRETASFFGLPTLQLPPFKKGG